MSINSSTIHNIFNLSNPNSSNYLSEEYLKMNRCGWSEYDVTNHSTKRPNGRADYNIIYIRAGNVTFGDSSVSEGNMYLYRPGEPQYYTMETKGTKIFWIHFSGYLADKLFKDTSFSRFKALFPKEFENFCLRTIKKYYVQTLDELTEMEVTGELLALLSRIAFSLKNPHYAPDKRIEKVITHIHNNLTEELSNEKYAQMCQLSKAYFIYKFTAETGVSPQRYRTNLLLDKSLSLLKETDLKINEISDMLGIEDGLYFSKLFKKRFNISPSQYRKTVQSN